MTRKLANLWENFVNKFFLYVPTFVVCITFLPCGLVFGYTICSLIAERNVNAGLIEYGPMIFGACTGCVIAVIMFLVKFYKGRIIFWHIPILLCAGVSNLLASCFYFANGLDTAGAFISYFAYSLNYIAGLSFLHTTLHKRSRSIMLTLAFSIFLLGTASAVSLVGTSYTKTDNNLNATATQVPKGLYVPFAGLYFTISIVILAVLIGCKVMDYLGIVDCQNILDNEFRIANSNGSIFDKRNDIIKRVKFLYVTKNQQWNVTLVVLFTEAIQYALFVYYIFWFVMNPAIRLTEVDNVAAMLWVVFAGSVVCILIVIFFSVKVTFVSNECCLIILCILSMIICNSVDTTVPLWFILFFFGLSFSNLQISLVEVTHFRYTELLFFVSYLAKLISTSMVYYYFVSNSKNSFFYATDRSTIMAQGFVYMIITALVALVVGVKVPRTHCMTLFEIQYDLLGIIFKQHEIEQLDVTCLQDGSIPTISAHMHY
ncbi:PREDICTED: uncharacterized protein LOC108365304 isoform X2 [Rhagoletis zephyria]|uniref:uncharacterized protein LOC108365304 isoform X1 n=1 Tax=Rhagoletis zephyria TaxID=28612 RepID=UPI0008117D83|nr:PREDICTED: uncharacterized protein LOC108365304 isoform X1 [Rhagoletis zephyria]XP_017474792.1 PREDICTED: uncharacterized protein LOC108365304 isoform X2 [Rhagoletis zephyria]